MPNRYVHYGLFVHPCKVFIYLYLSLSSSFILNDFTPLTRDTQPENFVFLSRTRGENESPLSLVLVGLDDRI